MSDIDFIVVGGGSAGCVVANRLSEDPRNSVVLLEAGEDSRHPLIEMPLTWMQASRDPRFDWGWTAEPDPQRNDRAEPMPRGKLLGGSSATNGTMYVRGAAADYDGWRDAGLAGWGYADVLPYFRRAETNWRGAGPYHGGSGPLHVSPMRPDPLLFGAFAEAARALGYPQIEDFNVPAPEGFGMPDCTIRKGRRHSTARAYLDPARGRRNLTVGTSALVRRIVVEDGRAVGVEIAQRGVVRTLRCRREVVLCAGALHSPHILLLSGIGPAAHLRDAGVAVVVDSPKVGANLQDHPIALSFWQAAGPVTFDRMLRLDRLALGVLRWQLTGTGMMSQSPMSIQGFVRSGLEQDRPDLQFQIVHGSYAARPWFPGWRAGAGHQFSTGALLLDPRSRGRIDLLTADPAAPPRIALNFLDDEHDLTRLRAAMRFTRRLLATEAARRVVADEIAPGAAAESDAAIDAWLRETVMSGAHQCGTCAMGTGNDDVVDAALRVRGVAGLRVADASVMPNIVRGNTNAPVIMIAEKASDLVLGRDPAAA